MLKEFLIYYLQNNSVKNILLLKAGVTTIPDLNHSDFLDTAFLLLPINEQIQIVEYLNTKVIHIINICHKIQNSISKLQEYRTALISAAVTGKIDVRQEITCYDKL